MSRNTKIILAVVSGLIVVAACVCLAAILVLQPAARSMSKAVVTNPGDVATVAAGIASYDLPAGYEETGMNFLGIYQGVVLTNRQDTQRLIMLFGVPNISGQEQNQFEKMLQQRLGQDAADIQWESPSSAPVEIRSQTVDLITRKGASKNGASRYQMESAVFQGIKGSVILLIAGPQQGWDQAAVDSFIKSIR